MNMVKRKKCYILNILSLTLIFFASFYSLAHSKNTDAAVNLVASIGTEIIDIVDNDSDETVKQIKLLKIFNDNADVLTISRAALGRKWRGINKETRNKFKTAFANYLIKKYGRQFEEFKGSKMIIQKSVDAGKRGVLVYSKFIMPGSTPISVKWQVWSKSNDLKLIDIIIEDISMLTMEREEIKNRLDDGQNSLNKLIYFLNNF